LQQKHAVETESLGYLRINRNFVPWTDFVFHCYLSEGPVTTNSSLQNTVKIRHNATVFFTEISGGISRVVVNRNREFHFSWALSESGSISGVDCTNTLGYDNGISLHEEVPWHSRLRYGSK